MNHRLRATTKPQLFVTWAATAEEPQPERQALSYSEMILSSWDSLVWLIADYF